MIGKSIFTILSAMIIVCSSFAGAVNIKNEGQKCANLIPLTNEDISRLDAFVKSIKDNETRKKVQEILEKIIKDGKFDTKSAEELAKDYYESSSKEIFPKNISGKANYLPLGDPLGTGTIFSPPYSSCFSWGDGTWGIDEYSYGCNSESGSVGAYANALVGGATAEAMQQLDFYVGRTKSVNIDAKIIRTGGKTTFGFAAFAGTEKTWSWDDFQTNYHRSDVDPWWSWDDIILKIINLVAVLVGYVPGNISKAISALASVVDMKALNAQLENMFNNSDAEELDIQFSFTADPGYHSIWVGLRSTASACITGTGSAVTMGQVSSITIDGIATPDSPSITGPASCKTGESCDFSAECQDPNNDNIKYFFDWGDGSNSGWTDYINSGGKVTKSHTYSDKGVYTIKVKVEDIDRMQSESLYSISITSKAREKNFLISQFLQTKLKNFIYQIEKIKNEKNFNFAKNLKLFLKSSNFRNFNDQFWQ